VLSLPVEPFTNAEKERIDHDRINITSKYIQEGYIPPFVIKREEIIYVIVTTIKLYHIY